MKEKNRSGSHSGGVVKNKSSSGCLIVKKKPDGVGGVGGTSGGRKLHESKKEKRLRLTGSNSVSSDGRRGISGPNQVSSAPVVYKRGVGNHGKFSSKVNDFDDGVFCRRELMRGAGHNRNKLDVYDFDEYDDLSDVERVGMKHFNDREIGGSESRFLSPVQGMTTGSGSELEGGSSKGDIIYRRRNLFKGGMSGDKIKGSDHLSVKRKFEVNNKKEKLGSSNEAIRLQGKNGVLKVMVKNKEENTAQLKPHNYSQVEGKNIVPRSQETTSKKIVTRPSLYSERKLQKKPMAINRIDKDQQRKRKPMPVERSEESDEESEDSDTSPKLQSDSVEVHRPVKRVRSEGSMQTPERAQPNKLNKGKVKRGSGTEKQLLREKIRNMLVTSGWTIDYRPRRGSDYFDAVYVNSAGTAYWSIVKAYDAFQKQLEEEGTNLKPKDDCSFAPISEDILSKLTRQTRRKIEKELNRKKIEDVRGKRKKQLTRRNLEDNESDTDTSNSDKHDEKLSSFIKRSGKSLKGAKKEAYFRDGSRASSEMQEWGEKSSSMSNSRSIHARKSKKIGRCTLLVRSSEKGLDSNSDGFVPYSGKCNLLSWLIDSGTVKLGEKVHYMNRRRTRIMLEGWITRDGIHCGCCSKILTISKFEIHAASQVRQPFQNICLSSGVSLLQCQVDAWNKQDESQRNGFHEIDVDGDDPNDDTCAICGDGGNLICCDSCPSTFHQNCLDIRMLPPGDWHCPHCSCKFCSLADVSLTEENNTRKDEVLSCSLCEGKYHASCMEEIVDTPANSNCPASFCGKKCQELFERLQKLLGVKHELEAGVCWSLIRRTDLDSDTSGLRYPQKVEWNSKLAVSMTVMDECFLSIIDRRSGINMIHNVLYSCGSNFTRLNYSGFYTAILERGDEVVSAASIRIRGSQFAEMPFIGTRHIYRHQGMCRRLFSAIELALRSLKVEKLIIPAISELMDTWTRVFGFSALGDSDKLEMKTLNMLVFPGTDMLQKQLLDRDSMKRDLAGADSLEVGNSLSVVPDLPNKCDLDASSEPSSGTAVLDNVMLNDKSVTDFNSQNAMASIEETSLHNTSQDVSNQVKPSDVSYEVKPPISIEGSQGTMSSSLQLDTKSNESVVEVKVQIFPDVSADIHEIRKPLGDSPAKHAMEASLNPELTQASEADAGNDDHVLSGGGLCLKNGSAVDMEQHSLSKASHDDVIVEKWSIASPTKGSIQDSMEVEVGGAHEVPTRRADVCSSSQTTELLTRPANGICRSPQITGHGAEGVERRQRASCNGDNHAHDNHGVSNIQEASSYCEISGENVGTVGVDKPQHDPCDASRSKAILEAELHLVHDFSVKVGSVQQISNNTCEISAKNVGSVGVEKPFLESEVLHVHDISVEVASVQPESNFSSKNDGTIGLEKTKLDSHDASIQSIMEGEVRRAHDTDIVVLPVSNLDDDEGAI